MCRSTAEGGQRCAAHTRPAYEAATFGTPEWDEAAAEFASTRTGAKELEVALFHAEREEDFSRVGALTAARRRGDGQRQAANAARQQILAAQNPTCPVDESGLPTRLVGDSAEYPGATVFRPHDRRLNNRRYVITPEGETWQINKHGVVMGEAEDPQFPGMTEVIFAEPETKRKVTEVVTEVDLDFKGCSCCPTGRF